MDMDKLITDLKEAKEQHDAVYATQTRIEKQLVKEEEGLLKTFALSLFDVAETKEIHGEDALLIYSFPEKEKTLISPDVYLSKDGKIKYEVYDEEKYRRFRQNAWIVDRWNIMEISEFLQYVTLEKIFSFLNERPNYLHEKAASFVAFNQDRKAFISAFKQLLDEK